MSWEMKTPSHLKLYQEWESFHMHYITFDQWLIDELVDARLRVKMLSGKPYNPDWKPSSFN